MRHAVFLRAANVGGRNVFKPAQFARQLASLDVVNVGAAGTFVVRGKASAAAIRREFLVRLPFAPELAIVPAKTLLALVADDPFAGLAHSKDVRGWVAWLTARSRVRPRLPISLPEGKAWSVRIERVEANFALGLWHRRPSGFVFPNQFLEKTLGVPATTRWWETILRVAELAETQQAPKALVRRPAQRRPTLA